MIRIRTLVLVAFVSAVAGFVQGAGVLASPPNAPATLDERPAAAHTEALTASIDGRRFWRPLGSTARAPLSTQERRAWVPGRVATAICTTPDPQAC